MDPGYETKMMYDGRKIYFSVLMSNFKTLRMLVLIRALTHWGSFHYSLRHVYQWNLGAAGSQAYFPSQPGVNRCWFAKCYALKIWLMPSLKMNSVLDFLYIRTHVFAFIDWWVNVIKLKKQNKKNKQTNRKQDPKINFLTVLEFFCTFWW